MERTTQILSATCAVLLINSEKYAPSILDFTVPSGPRYSMGASTLGYHLDSGSVASPNRETESMRDGSDAVSDWPLLNALLNTAGGATWVSLHHGGGVGMGYSQHSGMVIVADGTDAAAKRLARVLVNDCGSGVMRHADAGYDIAIATAKKQGLKLPMLK